MKKNIIVVVFYICLAVIVITSFCNNKNGEDGGKITYSEIEQADVKEKNNDNVADTKKVLQIKGDVSKNLSPFIYNTKADRYILDKCYINIYNELKKIEQKAYSDYFESIESDSHYIKKEKNKNGQKITTYTLRLKEGIRSAAGNLITADDLMFNYYLRFDSSYEASDKVYKCRIPGLISYQTGIDDSKKAEKCINSKINKPSSAIKKKIKNKIIHPEIKDAFEWTSSLYRDETYSYITDKYPRTRDLFVYFFAQDPKYRAKNKVSQTVIKDVAKQYGWDYKKLGKVTGKDYTAQVKKIVLNEIGKKSASKKQRIKGLTKTDSYTIQIQVYEKTSQKNLFDFYIVPLAKWGNVEYFDSNYRWGVWKTKAYEITQRDIVTGDETGEYRIGEREPYKLVER